MMSKLIISGGTFRSGSTWLFNVLIKILEESYGEVYARNSDDFLPEMAAALQRNVPVVIKSHTPSAALSDIIQGPEVVIFWTCRDPRDSVVSFMSQFGLSFDEALTYVSRSCDFVVNCPYLDRVHLLKYEEEFFNIRSSVRQIAESLGLVMSDKVYNAIFWSVGPDSVRNIVADLMRQDVMDGRDPLNQWDGRTQWHPYHVGDRRIGKYREKLKWEQRQKVVKRNREFLERFEYRYSTVQLKLYDAVIRLRGISST